MQNKLILSFGIVLVAACGGNSNAPANDPSSSSTTAAPAAPAASTTTTTTTTTTAEPAKPEGKCGTNTAPATATALDGCMAECEKLSDKAPEGSKCMPPRTECKMGCKHKFESAK